MITERRLWCVVSGVVAWPVVIILSWLCGCPFLIIDSWCVVCFHYPFVLVGTPVLILFFIMGWVGDLFSFSISGFQNRVALRR